MPPHRYAAHPALRLKVIIHVIAARVRMDMKIAFADVKDQMKRFYADKNKKKKKKK